jgi:hypothetical protein
LALVINRSSTDSEREGSRRTTILPDFLTVVFTAYPFSSNIFTSADAMYPSPPVTHADFLVVRSHVTDVMSLVGHYWFSWQI